MGKNRQLVINLVTTFIVLIVNIIINFGLSRYIVDAIGEEAYGFISLANNFVAYATIFTTALNSMASRFITIDIYNKRYESANKFFSSVLIANLIIILFLIIPSVFLIIYLQYILKIPVNLITDVKILFALIFFNFFINLIGGVFTIATYCTNKLYLSSLRKMESAIINVLIIVGLFVFFKPQTFYIGIGAILASIYIVLFNVYYTKKLIPEIKIKKSNFSGKKIGILLSSGLWNTVTNLGNVLCDGLDLIISNLAIDAATMGIVAIAKLPSNVFNTIISTISNVFQPQIISYYAKGDIDNVKIETIKGMKINGVFGNIPFAYVIAFGFAFCSTWMPNVENNVLSILFIITFINIFVGGLISPLYNIFTITNHVKGNALLNICSGIVSTLIVLLLLNITKLGVYAIVGVSAVIGLLKGFIIVPIYAAYCLNIEKKTFIPPIFKYFVATIIMAIAFLGINFILPVNGWLTLGLSVILCGIIGIIVNLMLFLNKEEKKALIGILLKGRKEGV